MKDISLIYSGSCPNYKATRQMLEEIGLAFIEINQDDLHEGCFGKNFSSPTLLVDNDIVIFGGETDSSGWCLYHKPARQGRSKKPTQRTNLNFCKASVKPHSLKEFS